MLDDAEAEKENQPGIIFLPFLLQIASLYPQDVPDSLEPSLRAALEKILKEEIEASDTASLILETLRSGRHATMQFGCLHALVIAAQQMTLEFGALELLANKVGPGALHNAAAVVCPRDSGSLQSDPFAK
ncbi:MAG: hypothetical protein AAGG44_21490, partial [Planctomycetota bacterium]